MTYSAPEKIPLTIANNTRGFSAAERAAILDNAQCVAFIVFWMIDNDYTDLAGFRITSSEVNNCWTRISVTYLGTCFFEMQECADGNWLTALGGNGTEAEFLARVAGQLGCDF